MEAVGPEDEDVRGLAGQRMSQFQARADRVAGGNLVQPRDVVDMEDRRALGRTVGERQDAAGAFDP